MDTGKNDPVCACSIIQSELKELLGLLYCLASLYLHCTEIGLREGIEIHFFFKHWLDLHIREINFLIRCKEPGLIGNSLFGGFRSALFPDLFTRMCFFVIRLEGLHCGEEENITDRRRIGQQHHETIDTIADTTSWRQTDLHRMKEVLIGVVSLFITGSRQCILCLEALTLIDRVVQLGVCVTHLTSVDIELKTLYLCRIGRLLLRQRRNLYRMIHDEGRLNHLLLTECLEETVLDVTDLMVCLVRNVMLIRQCTCLLEGLYRVKINTALLLDGIRHRQTAERLAEIDLGALVADEGLPTYLLCEVAEHALRELHHTVVIGIGLIQLHQCELRIMTGIDTLITEYTADLEHTLETTDDETLEIKLEGNTKLYVLVQCVIVGLERTGSGTTGILHQHRCLHLHEATSIEEVTNLTDDLRTLDEDILRILVHDEVNIALTISRIGILQTMELLRKRIKRLRQKCK